MDLSIFLFRLFGFYLVITGLAYLFKQEFFKDSVENYYKSPGLILVSGVFTVIVGLILVLNYSVWEFSAKGVVTLLAWITLFKGIMRLFFPYWGEEFSSKIITGTGAYIAGGLSVLIGSWLLFEGYA